MRRHTTPDDRKCLSRGGLASVLATPCDAARHIIMSFAATLALVAGYQQRLPWMSKGGETPLATKIALWGGREVAGLLIVSLLAGTATIPIAYHFHRMLACRHRQDNRSIRGGLPPRRAGSERAGRAARMCGPRREDALRR